MKQLHTISIGCTHSGLPLALARSDSYLPNLPRSPQGSVLPIWGFTWIPEGAYKNERLKTLNLDGRQIEPPAS